MTTAQQPEAHALYLARELKGGSFAPNILQNEQGLRRNSADELIRLHARVVELEAGRRAIIAEKDDYKLALRKARSDLEAIGAGGVESLSCTKPLTDDEIEAVAKPFIRSLGGDHWYSGEDGIPDRGQIEEFARAIESHHGIK